MAHHRLGHHDETKRWLDKLVAYQPTALSETSYSRSPRFKPE
jgi:hypothetical protein